MNDSALEDAIDGFENEIVQNVQSYSGQNASDIVVQGQEWWRYLVLLFYFYNSSMAKKGGLYWPSCVGAQRLLIRLNRARLKLIISRVYGDLLILKWEKVNMKLFKKLIKRLTIRNNHF